MPTPGAHQLVDAPEFVNPAGVVAQQYAPDEIADRTYYAPTRHGAERPLIDRVRKLRAIVRPELASVEGTDLADESRDPRGVDQP